MNRPKIVPIRMPNPYFEKDNNAYLIDAGELILIDTGIDLPEAVDKLKSAIAENGYEVAQISKILLTHKHLDHFGLTHRLLDESDAEVFIHADDLPDVAQFEERDEKVTRLYEQRLHGWGVPQELVDMIGIRSLILRLGRSIPASPLAEGQKLNADGVEIDVIHTPGHTQGCVCYKMGDWLFTGDHLLPTYTPNIGATDVTSQNMLAKYRESLLKIRALDVSKVFPGHGDPFDDHRGRVDAILKHHEEREERILEILSEHNATYSVYEIALRLFGTLKDHHVLLGAGEVHAHLEFLLGKGLVVADEQHLYSRA